MSGRPSFLAKRDRWIEYDWYETFVVLSDLSYGLVLQGIVRFFSYPKCPDRHWVPRNLLFSKYRGLSPREQNGRSVTLITHIHIVMKLKNVWICTCTLPISPRRTQGHALPPQSVLLKLQVLWIGDYSTSNTIGVARFYSRLGWANTWSSITEIHF
jgi:hypothetical protein